MTPTVYTDALKQYYFAGEMPEAVQCFADERNFNEVRLIQQRILSAYEQDFSKHAPASIVPVEVKAETNLKAKSLRTYYEKFRPEISVRTSMADYKKEEWLLNLPLYAVESVADELKLR